MVNSFVNVRLGEIAAINMGQSPSSKFYNKDKVGLPFLQGKSGFGNRFPNIVLWCSEPKKIAKSGEVLLSVRAPVGEANIANLDICIGRGLASLSMKNGNNNFLYYLLKNIESELKNIYESEGTVFGNLNKSGIENHRVFIPHSSEYQRKISNILRVMDDKIEINIEINSELVNFGKILFRRWFVDCEYPDDNGEPYRRSGGKMKESALGKIPDNWDVKNLEYYGIIAGGSTPSTKESGYWGGDIPWITPRDLSHFQKGQIFITEGERNITKRAKEECSLRIFPKGSVLLSSRAPIGYLAIADADLTCNQGFKNIIPNNDFYSEFLYFLLIENIDIIKSFAGGSTFREISGRVLREIQVVVPSDSIIKRFHEILNPIFKIIKNDSIENVNLNQLRDISLPRLMSGEINVYMEAG